MNRVNSRFAALAAVIGLQAFAFSTACSAQAYLIADRTIPERLVVLGISGLYPEGCESGSATCGNIVVKGRIERVSFLEDEDFPSGFRLTDDKSGRTHFIRMPYEQIWDEIGTADVSWLGQWLKPGMLVTVIGVSGGSSDNISIDSIYLTSFLEGA